MSESRKIDILYKCYVIVQAIFQHIAHTDGITNWIMKILRPLT